MPATPLVYRADRQGSFMLDASVNGAPVRFLLDTGATHVTLTSKDAAAAGISGNQLVFRGLSETANGIGRFAPVRLREMRIGQLSVMDMPAGVVENLSTSLLGMSFLRHFQFEMSGDVLTITCKLAPLGAKI